jgi:hypothetical protein
MTSCRPLLPSSRYRSNSARQGASACWLRSSRRCHADGPRASPRWSHDEGSPLVLLRRNEVGGRRRQHRPAERRRPRDTPQALVARMPPTHEPWSAWHAPERGEPKVLLPASSGGSGSHRHRRRHDAAPRQGGRAGPRLLASGQDPYGPTSPTRAHRTPKRHGQIGADAFPHQLLREPRSATARFRRTSPRGTPRCPRSPPHARSRSV